jgi:hypothetical protein
MVRPTDSYLYDTINARHATDPESQPDFDSSDQQMQRPPMYITTGCILSIFVIGTFLYYASSLLNDQAFTILCMVLMFAVSLSPLFLT